MTAQGDTPVDLLMCADGIRDLICAAVNQAHAIKETDPALAARLIVAARKLERRLLVVKPIPYRPAPVDVVIEYDNVGVLVNDYVNGDWPGTTTATAVQ